MKRTIQNFQQGTDIHVNVDGIFRGYVFSRQQLRQKD